MIEMLLVVVLAGRRAVLPAVEVNSVIEVSEVTPIPRTAAHVAGLAALRSRPLTLIDCVASLGVGREPCDPRSCRAVVVEHEGHLYGLLVEAADDIVAARSEALPLGADPGPGWSRVANGRIETEAGALPFLDIGALIAGPGESLAA
jgi:purine-binding chemotaxis protein CheW